MVAILHGKGFHGLRVFPYMYPLAYRVELYPAAFAGQDGVKHSFGGKLQTRKLIARHSAASGAHYFAWDDATELSSHELALLFIERFPEIARVTYHFDYAYAGWYATLLAHCSYGYLPYLFGEYEPEIGVMRLQNVGAKRSETELDQFPLPPLPAKSALFEPRPTPDWMNAAEDNSQ